MYAIGNEITVLPRCWGHPKNFLNCFTCNKNKKITDRYFKLIKSSSFS